MKKIVGLSLMLVMSVVLNVRAATVATPVKVSLFPKLAIPSNQVVHGLDLGLIATKVDEVQGVQLGWLYCGTSKKMVGLQSGFVSGATIITGLQWGFINVADDVTGVQAGFINVTAKMKGVQIGLVNVIKKGVVPAMVFINANF
jgi:hypothetical protein